MFPTKAKMVRAVNALLVILAIAPLLYISIVAILVLEGRGFAGSPGVTPFLFPALAAVSIANIAVTVYFQTRWRPFPVKSQFLLVNNTFLRAYIGAVLSEAHSIYGLILSILSGSILYAIGFSLVTWMSLLWVRSRFKQNLARIPDG